MSKKLFLSIFIVFMAFSCVFGGGIFLINSLVPSSESGQNIPNEDLSDVATPTVSFVTSGADLSSSSTTASVSTGYRYGHGTSGALPTATKTGNTFGGWSTRGYERGTFTINGLANDGWCFDYLMYDILPGETVHIYMSSATTTSSFSGFTIGIYDFTEDKFLTTADQYFKIQEINLSLTCPTEATLGNKIHLICYSSYGGETQATAYTSTYNDVVITSTSNKQVAFVDQIAHDDFSTSNENYRWHSIYSGVKPGYSYKIRFGSVVKNSGSATNYTTLIIDFTTSTILNRYECSVGALGYNFLLVCPNDATVGNDIQILVYEGSYGSTSGNNITFTEISVAETYLIDNNSIVTTENDHNLYAYFGTTSITYDYLFDQNGNKQKPNLFDERYLFDFAYMNYEDGIFESETAEAAGIGGGDGTGNLYTGFFLQAWDGGSNYEDLVAARISADEILEGDASKIFSGAINKGDYWKFVRFKANGTKEDAGIWLDLSYLEDGEYTISFELTLNTNQKVICKNVKIEAGVEQNEDGSYKYTTYSERIISGTPGTTIIPADPDFRDDYVFRGYKGENIYLGNGNARKADEPYLIKKDYFYLDKLTVSCWAYKEDWSIAAGGNPIGLMSCYDVNNGGFVIELTDNCYLRMYVRDVEAGYNQIRNINHKDFSAGWHHFAFTFDGKYLQFYLDGNKMGDPFEWPSDKIALDGNNYIAIGDLDIYCDIYDVPYIEGVKIFNEALNAQQIRELETTMSYTFTEKDETFVADWETTINIDFNGGQQIEGYAHVPKKILASYGDTITLPMSWRLERDGFDTHYGWNSTNVISVGNEFGDGSEYKITGNTTLYANWKPIEHESLVFGMLFEDEITENSYVTTLPSGLTADDFGFYVDYRSLKCADGNDTTLESKQVLHSTLGNFWGARQCQTITIRDVICPDGWACTGVVFSESENPALTLPEFESQQVDIGTDSDNIYLCFKKLSDNRLRYDSTDKYFYFEDGVFPQTAVVTLENGVELEAKLNSLTATTTEIDGLGTAKFVTLNGFKYMGVQVVEDDGDSTTTATKTVKLRDNDSSSATYLQYKDYTFSEGIYYWFRFEPIRWRVSDYGVSEDEIPTDWSNYAQGQTNAEVVSDVLWFDALNDKENKLGVGDSALQTTLSQKLMENILLGLNAYGNTNQRNLPSTYQQVDYIENVHGCIDTGIVPNQDTRIVLDFKPGRRGNSGEYFPILGSRAEGARFELWSYNNTRQMSIAYGNTDAQFSTNWYWSDRAVVSNVGGKWYSDGALVYEIEDQTFESLSTITLFSVHLSDSRIDVRRGSGKLYSLKIYDDKTLVRDFVPCYRIDDNVIGLYDLVEDKFYTNVDGGNFTCGQDSTFEYSQENSIIEIDNWATTKSYALPSAYQKVEYIEGTGTQYIDTGFTANQNTKIVFDFDPEKTGTTNSFYPVLGSRKSGGSNAFGVWIHNINSIVALNYAITDTGQIAEWVWEDRAVVSNVGGKWFSDGELMYEVVETSFTCPKTLTVFTMNNASGIDARKSSGKLYSLKIYDLNIIVRDFVPCYRKSDYVAGLYDLIEDKFYTNLGSGDFSVGQDVNDSSSETTNTNKKVTTSEDIYLSDVQRIASLSEIGGYQSDLRSYASQLVCVLSGKAQNQYFEYWTRDFGQQIGAGTYVTRSGVVMKNSYYTARKGVRFAYNMSEGSNTGDFIGKGNLYDCSNIIVYNGTLDQQTKVFTYDFTNTRESVENCIFFSKYQENKIIPGKKYVYVLNIIDIYADSGSVGIHIGDTSSNNKAQLSYAYLLAKDVGKYEFLLTATDYSEYAYFCRGFFGVSPGERKMISFTIEVYEYDEYINM